MLTRDSVLRMPPGASGVAKPVGDDTLQAFQNVVLLLQELQAEGEIVITHTHREEESGHDYIEVVMFRRRERI